MTTLVHHPADPDPLEPGPAASGRVHPSGPPRATAAGFTELGSELTDRRRSRGPAARWLLDGTDDQGGGNPAHPEKKHSWWQVMCLTGVDYFSTLGYQPAIAALAAGTLAPLATLVLIVVTLAGALPIYRRVAAESPRGEGSIAMLEKLLGWWGGKLFVLALLGFAATDFLITMTLSAADASAHLTENPFAPAWLHGQEVGITLVLLALLGAVFLRGFREAIGIAVALVGAFLLLNAVVIVVAFVHLAESAPLVDDWWATLTTQHGDPLMMVAVALLVFPKLALGLSGFETGVAVMPQIDGGSGTPEERLARRIRGAKRLLTTAALIMSAFLLTSSIVTTILIPAAEFQPGGSADGRALAYLAHAYLGDWFGTAYDVVTIAILWFAGASAMAGLLNLVPRYLPRFGMAPAWARAVRPLVLVFTAVAFLVTILFQADVNAQGGAYATGVLVLMTSAAVAVTLSARRRGHRRSTLGFGAIAVVFVYVTVANVIERPDGVRIAACFIVGIVVVSLLSRVRRSFELRAASVSFDEQAVRMIELTRGENIRLIANEPGETSREEYRSKLMQERADAHIPDADRTIFIEVELTDSSNFETDLEVRGVDRFGYRVLEVRAPNVPNTIAAVLLGIRDLTGVVPHIYFEWTEGNPISNMFRFLVTGSGEVAPVTREVLREAEPELSRRPSVHVG